MDEFKLTRQIQNRAGQPFLARYQVFLVEMEGRNEGRTHSLTGERITIGRSDTAHIAIDDDVSSRFHAVLTLTPTGYEVRDLHSTNGTFVNGQKSDLQALTHGDTIRIGKTVLRYLAEPRENEHPRVYDVSE